MYPDQQTIFVIEDYHHNFAQAYPNSWNILQAWPASVLPYPEPTPVHGFDFLEVLVHLLSDNQSQDSPAHSPMSGDALRQLRSFLAQTRDQDLLLCVPLDDNDGLQLLEMIVRLVAMSSEREITILPLVHRGTSPKLYDRVEREFQGQTVMPPAITPDLYATESKNLFSSLGGLPDDSAIVWLGRPSMIEFKFATAARDHDRSFWSHKPLQQLGQASPRKRRIITPRDGFSDRLPMNSVDEYFVTQTGQDLIELVLSRHFDDYWPETWIILSDECLKPELDQGMSHMLKKYGSDHSAYAHHGQHLDGIHHFGRAFEPSKTAVT